MPNNRKWKTTTPPSTTSTKTVSVVPEALPVVGDPEDSRRRPDPDGAAASLRLPRADLRVHRGRRDEGALPPDGDHGFPDGLLVDDSRQEVPPGHGSLDPGLLHGELFSLKGGLELAFLWTGIGGLRLSLKALAAP